MAKRQQEQDDGAFSQAQSRRCLTVDEISLVEKRTGSTELDKPHQYFYFQQAKLAHSERDAVDVVGSAKNVGQAGKHTLSGKGHGIFCLAERLRDGQHRRVLELDKFLRPASKHGQERFLLLLVELFVVHQRLLVELPHRHSLARRAIRCIVDL